MPKRRLRREEDRPKREEVKYLEVEEILEVVNVAKAQSCLLYTSPSPRDGLLSRMPSSA